MAQLVIKGHQTRGKEVIEILEMLGGNNPDKLIANFDYLGYFIGKETRNIYLFHLQGFDSQNVIIFTLEEFLEKYPYKVGDKVTVTGLPEYPKSIHFMKWFANNIHYSFDNETWFLPSALQPYKEEAMDKAVFDANAQCCDIMNHLIKEETMEEKIESFEILESHCANEVKIEFDPSKFEIVKRDNGYYVVKKLPQYPKTYVECAKILECFSAYNIDGYKNELLEKLQELLICRDAYWKIAGEQMGLDKPWAPDYTDDNIKYNITIHRNELDFNCTIERNYVLIFPTEEMRDAFYENFKELIEECKELL